MRPARPRSGRSWPYRLMPGPNLYALAQQLAELQAPQHGAGQGQKSDLCVPRRHLHRFRAGASVRTLQSLPAGTLGPRAH